MREKVFHNVFGCSLFLPLIKNIRIEHAMYKLMNKKTNITLEIVSLSQNKIHEYLF